MGKKGKLTQHMKGGKGKRWKKGHSSSSNPTTRKFREAAKNRFFVQNTGGSSLTEEALARHNEGQEEREEESVISDVVTQTDKLSITAKTFNTWASNWTECTNASFSRVHRYWHSNSAFHKEILAVLAAVTEVIKTQGGTESETEYLAALLVALETSDNSQSLGAISYLISLVIKRVPVPVLRSKFSEIAKKLLHYLGQNADGDSTSLLKSLLSCLGSLLRVQEQIVWNHASTVQVYTGLLTFIVHAKPKVRKAAHQAVIVIVKGSVFMTQGDPPPNHPAASMTAKYCIQQIEECGGTGEAMGTLHTLVLLSDLLGVFPQNSLKSACETILRVMTVSNVMVTACSMQTLHGMFLSSPKSSRLPAELNAQIITALYDYQPSETDVQPMQAWFAVMEAAHVNLGHLDEKLCVSHLPRIYTTAMSCLLSEKREVAGTAAEILQNLTRQCLSPAAENLGSLVESSPAITQTPVHRIQGVLESGLGYQYHAAWDLVLNVFSVYYTAVGKHCWRVMTKSLELMAGLRESVRFAYKAELDEAVGRAVRTMGPRRVLQAIPLNVTGDDDRLDFPRSWLLPVLHTNIQQAELGFFTSHFLPLAVKLNNKATEFSKKGHSVQAKSYDALQLQIWSLLPCFCTGPTDLPQSFPGIAKVLGMALTERDDLRMDIMASLRKLVLQNLENGESKAVLMKFAKNYLPILFNLYTSDSESESKSVKLAVLETIKIYLQITDKQLIANFFDNCHRKIKEESELIFKSYSLLDLILAMLPYLDKSRLSSLHDLAKTHVQTLDKTLQKKSYRLLEELCACKSEESRSFVTAAIADFQDTLLASLSSSGPSSKGPRLKCLIHLFKQLDSGHEEFLLAVVPEAILCTKEIGERARLAAYNLLVEMAKALIRWSAKSEEDVLETYFETVTAGLAGSPHMISATLLALTRLLYQFKDDVSNRLLDLLVGNACILLDAKQREIIKSSLAFIKVILASFPDVRLSCYLEKLVSSLVGMKEDSRRHFRFKAKEIFARLIRKFSYETIVNMVPESYHKLLANIRKSQERAKKKKHEQDKEMDTERPSHPREQPESIEDMLRDTDSEMEGDDTDKQRRKTKKTKQKQRMPKVGDAWLNEGDDENEIMDFLDPSAAKKVMATKPPQKGKEGRQRRKEGEFKMTPDGRLIITAEPTADDKGQSGDEDDLQDLLDAFESNNKPGKKRKAVVGDDNDDIGPSVSKYQAGGSGIHRPLGKGGKSFQQEEKPKVKGQGLEYKAKKAGGDIKRKGLPDPYAYVPLQFTNLNRRKQAKLKGQFSGFVRGAKKGAAKGAKSKRKSRQ